MRIIFGVLIFLVLLFMAGCQNATHDTSVVGMNDLSVSDEFNYNATQEVMIHITALSNQNQPVENVKFTLYTADPEQGGDLIGSGVTNQEGVYESKLTVPTAQKSVFSVGMMQSLSIPIQNGLAQCVMGGNRGKNARSKTPMSLPRDSFVYLKPFNSHGTPIGMEFDTVPVDFVNRINYTLPERQAVPDHHPQYTTNQNQLNLKILDEADVWITFLSEGAAWRNSLGFYSYPVGHSINSVSDIDTMKIIFPNASQAGAGGELVAGDKMYLGHFPANTMIGWFLVADGWNGTGVGPGICTYYSNKALNPEPTTLRQHNVFLWDGVFQKLVMGFEDRNRTASNCDNDFNDAVYYVTVTPTSSIDDTDIPNIDDPNDRDHDGVPDGDDDYPDDPDRAFDNYTPSESSFSTLAYEDLWPDKGDFDFNDMVVDYNINQITNARGKVKEIRAKYNLRAMGAIYNNGFAVELPFSASKIETLTGNHAPVLESDGTNAVVRLYDGGFSIIPRPQNQFINTVTTEPWHTPQLVTFNVIMANVNTMNPVLFNHQPPYNPFIYQRGVRSHEIHLANYAPTAKMDMALFGTGDDTSDPANGRYYKTRKNQPWALNVPVVFDYPRERVQITNGYLKFAQWAQSNGTNYPDWYMNLPDYRDGSFLYIHP